MIKPIRVRVVPVAVLLSGLLIASGCSGPTEDVRIKTCKQLATTLLQADDKVEWLAPKQTIREPEYARITVQAMGGSQIKAVCFYEYDAAEETMETHVDPLSAYSTVPYEMSLNGQAVTTAALYKAMNSLRLEAGKRLLEKVKGAAAKTYPSGAVPGY